MGTMVPVGAWCCAVPVGLGQSGADILGAEHSRPILPNPHSYPLLSSSPIPIAHRVKENLRR